MRFTTISLLLTWAIECMSQCFRGQAFKCNNNNGWFSCPETTQCCSDQELADCTPGCFRSWDFAMGTRKCDYDGCGNVEGYVGSCLLSYCVILDKQYHYFYSSCPALPSPCPAGKYSLGSVCTTCTSEHFCPGDSYLPLPCKKCSGTTFRSVACSASTDAVCNACSANSITSPTNDAACICKAGYYRTALPSPGAPSCTACPAGQGSTDDSTSCTACAAGYYSLVGTLCIICPEGFQCPNKNQAPVQCTAGYFCGAGSTSQTPCTTSNFCLSGSASQTRCPAGFYCASTNTAPVQCSAGTFCLSGSTAQSTCTAGNFCLAGSASQTQCPAGSYCQYPNQAPVTCSPGFFCVAGSTSQTACTGASVYCGTGSSAVSICPAGSYCETPSTIAPCPAGFACVNGQYNECGFGSLCPQGSTTETDCPVGWFCQDSTVKQICPAGSRCPVRSIEPLLCVATTYCPEGSSVESTCPLGYFCLDPATKTLCPAGSSCPSGATAAIPCPVNTSCVAGSTSPTYCPIFYYCPSTSVAPALCSGSGICPGNTSAPLPCTEENKCAPIGADKLCPPGYKYLIEVSATPRVCVPCNLGIPGITYTDGCNFKCPEKYWRNGLSCNPCTVRNCTFGMYSTQCLDAADTICTACTTVGNISSWTDSLCNFTCKAGFFRNGSVCSTCTNPTCDPGTYQTQCNPINNYCADCTVPSGPYTFTSGCNFSCSANTYRNNMTCSVCSFAKCATGFYRTTCLAGSVEPSICANCTRPSGNFSWTSGCNFTCGTGSYLKNSTTCATCTTPACVPGTYASDCTNMANRQCLNCTIPAGNYSWVSGCTFACNAGLFLASPNNCSKCTLIAQCQAGYYKIPCIGDQDAACLPCNTTQCIPGKYRTSCATGSNSDSACATCPVVLGDFDRTTECGFQCKAGNFQVDGQLICSPCSADPCPTNFYRSVCQAGSTQDATCAPCATSCPDGQYYDTCVCRNCEAPLGRFEWGQRCNFTCANDSYLAGPTECSLCSSLTCPIGQFYENCSCFECPAVVGNFIRGNQCEFACAEDSYLAGPNECRPCSSMVCKPGQYYVGCSCSACRAVVGNFSWSSLCEFTCASDSYLAGPRECKQCSNMTCPAGSFMQPCNATSDATCAPCARPKGMFSWVGGCDYVQLTTTVRMQSTTVARSPNTTSIPETTPAPPAAFIASVVIAKTYTEVCSNTSYYVDGICQGLRETNPGSTFTCRAQSLNGQECPNGVCTCVNNRRLLGESCNFSVYSESNMQTEPKVAKFRPWVQEIVVVVVQKAPDTSGLIVVIAGVIAALIVICAGIAGIAYMSRRVVVIVRAPNTGNAIHNLKIL